jgi:hypothetical protein
MLAGSGKLLGFPVSGLFCDHLLSDKPPLIAPGFTIRVEDASRDSGRECLLLSNDSKP